MIIDNSPFPHHGAHAEEDIFVNTENRYEMTPSLRKYELERTIAYSLVGLIGILSIFIILALLVMYLL